MTHRNIPKYHMVSHTLRTRESTNAIAKMTDLVLMSYEETARVIPDSLLGGSAPSLRRLGLNGVPFPGLPKLLLSAAHLVGLNLWRIPHSGYFSPEDMLTALSTLTSLQYLWLEFKSPRSRPDRAGRRPQSPARVVLPVLKRFSFKGLANTWTTLWPTSMPLDSSSCT